MLKYVETWGDGRNEPNINGKCISYREYIRLKIITINRIRRITIGHRNAGTRFIVPAKNCDRFSPIVPSGVTKNWAQVIDKIFETKDNNENVIKIIFINQWI